MRYSRLLGGSIPANTLLTGLRPVGVAEVSLPGRLVMSEVEAAQSVGLSSRTLRAKRITGDGPAYVQLSDRRIGYTEQALREWVDRRSVASTSAATVGRRAHSK